MLNKIWAKATSSEQPKKVKYFVRQSRQGSLIGMPLLSHENSISYPLGYWLPCPNVAHHNIRLSGWCAGLDGGGAGGAAHFRLSHGFNYALTAYPEIQLHSITIAGPNMTVSALPVGTEPPEGTSSVMDIFWTMALVKIQSANFCASFAMPTTVCDPDSDPDLDPDSSDNQCDWPASQMVAKAKGKKMKQVLLPSNTLWALLLRNVVQHIICAS